MCCMNNSDSLSFAQGPLTVTCMMVTMKEDNKNVLSCALSDLKTMIRTDLN
jgi:hypothetical protein